MKQLLVAFSRLPTLTIFGLGGRCIEFDAFETEPRQPPGSGDHVFKVTPGHSKQARLGCCQYDPICTEKIRDDESR